MLDEQCLITFGSGIPSTHPQSSLRQAAAIIIYHRHYREAKLHFCVRFDGTGKSSFSWTSLENRTVDKRSFHNQRLL